MKKINMTKNLHSRLVLGTFLLGSTMFAQADIQHLDDVIISFSLCTGNDCVNGESFGFDTQRLKENNLRVHFDDTSVSASFPRNDWRIIINDSSNGGDSYFAVEDSTAGRQVFRVDAGAPANALRVDSAGDVGIGTSNPVVDLHVVSGNTPTLRLEQNGSSGFTPQTWDLAGNEANFFIRDVTNGSKLPFRIQPGSGTDNALYIANDGDIGLGTQSPGRNVDIERNGLVALGMTDTSTSAEWVLQNYQNDFRITKAGSGGVELTLDDSGNLTVLGNFISGSTTLNVPDYVFKDDYSLMSLDQVESFIKEKGHLPKVPSEQDIKRQGVNISQMQMILLEKIEELTLYTLQQKKNIHLLHERLAEVEKKYKTNN